MPPRRTSAKPRPKKAKQPQEKTKKSGAGHSDAPAIQVFNHPLRLKILVSLNEEGEGAATDLADRLDEKLGNCSYHLGVLATLNFVEYVRTEQRGNAGKKIYRAIRRAELDTEEWDELPDDVKDSWIYGVFRDMYRDAEIGLSSGSFGVHPESPVYWSRIKVDGPAWQAIVNIWDDAWEKSMDVAAKAAPRLNEVESEGGEVLKVSIHAAAYPLKQSPSSK